MTITGSPYLDTLDFAVLYDISSIDLPVITITNQSTGADLTPIRWWLVITSPSGYVIHAGTKTTPDKSAPWTTFATAPGDWPLPFNSQIEFGSAYSVTLYAWDGDNSHPVFQFTKTTSIVRPAGNKANCNQCPDLVRDTNFGWADVEITTKCAEATIYAEDTTNYSYQGTFPQVVSKDFILDYPLDSTGVRPDKFEVASFTNAVIPITYGGPGYTVFLTSVMRYNFDNGTSVLIKYKFKAIFSVYCNIDLSPLICDFRRLIEDVRTGREPGEKEANQNKLNLITSLMMEAIILSIKPDCMTDMAKIVDEIKKIGGFSCNCYAGVNTRIPTARTGAGCCPVTINVLDTGGGLCANLVYPVAVKNPSNTATIGMAASPADIVNQMNMNSEWLALGVAFGEGNCKVGVFPVNSGVTVPNVYVVTGNSTACTGNTQNYSVIMRDICLPLAPITLANFPLNAYVSFTGNVVDAFLLGHMTDQAAMITALNALPSGSSSGQKPAGVTFSAGSTADVVTIFNSDCNAFNTPIAMFCDAASTEFVVLGTGHGSFVTTSAGQNIIAYGVKGNTMLGRLAPFATLSERPYHSVLLSNGTTMLVTDGKKGVVHRFNTNSGTVTPLKPVYFGSVPLPIISSNTFTGVPIMHGIGGSAMPAYDTLYMPTDENSLMTATNSYVFDSLTGTAWNFDVLTGHIWATFQDNRLIGKCPRVLVSNGSNGTPYIYFTQDGTLEGDTGQSSGVLSGYIVILNCNNFSSAGIGTQLLLANEEIWAASFDKMDTIWFLGIGGSLIRYRVSTGTVLNVYSNMLKGNILKIRSNVVFYNNYLYVSSLDKFTGFSYASIMGINVSVLPTIANFEFPLPPSNTFPAQNVNSILPLGNCLLLVFGEGTSPDKIGSILMYKTDGTYLTSSQYLYGATNLYNGIAFPNIAPPYTPTNFAP